MLAAGLFLDRCAREDGPCASFEPVWSAATCGFSASVSALCSAGRVGPDPVGENAARGWPADPRAINAFYVLYVKHK